MSNQELVQHVEALKSVEPAVRSVSRFKELPLWKRGITLATLGLSTIAAACSGTAGNETTTTPPTTIETITTITTEAPSTTTSTTLAEPTTTTEAEPEITVDLTRPSGEVKYEGDPILGLTPDRIEPNENQVAVYLVNIREQNIVGFGLTTIYDIVPGINEDGSPVNFSVMMGRDGTDWIFTHEYISSRIPQGLRHSTVWDLSDINANLKERLERTGPFQLVLSIYTGRADNVDFSDCDDPGISEVAAAGCERFQQGENYFENNKAVIDQLKNQIMIDVGGTVKTKQIISVIDSDFSLPDDNNLLWAQNISIFPELPY